MIEDKWTKESEDYKRFKRFLKEEGVFIFVMDYLFEYGRGEEEFFKDVNYLYSNAWMKSFGDVLHLRRTLGPADSIINWEKYMKPISDKLKVYFNIK